MAAAPAPAPASAAPAAKPAAASDPGPSNRDSQFQPGRENPFDAVDKKVSESTKPKPKAADVAPKPGDAPKGPDGQPIDTGPKALRKQLETVTGELTTTKGTMAELQKKIAEYEAKGKDTTALTDQLTTERKEREALQAELRALKQEASPEFKAKYEQPFNDAAEFAKNLTSQLVKADGTAFTFEGDFAALYQMPYNKAYAMAREMLGEDATVVMEQVRDLHKLDFTKKQAFEKEKATWKERETKSVADAAAQKEQINSTWANVNKELAETVAEYHDAPEETEFSSLRKEGLAIYDAQPKTMQQRIVKDAHIRQRVAAYPVLLLKAQKAQSKVAELEAALAEAKGSSPGDTHRSGVEIEGGEGDDWKSELRKNRSAMEQP